jgi:hypothetical protein
LEESVVVGEKQKDENAINLVDLLLELANFAKAEAQCDQSAAAEAVHVVHFAFGGNALGHQVAHLVAQSLQEAPQHQIQNAEIGAGAGDASDTAQAAYSLHIPPYESSVRVGQSRGISELVVYQYEKC